MGTVNENIRAARIARGLTQGQLAKLIHVKSGNVVYNWEASFSSPDSEKIARICDALDISADIILGTKVEKTKLTPTETKRLEKIRALDEHGVKMVDMVLDAEWERSSSSKLQKKVRLLQLPEYGLPASAGTGNYLDSDDKQKIVVPSTPEAEAADYVVRISGDSMEPEFHDGDRVFVQADVPVEIGEVGIFILNNESYIKKLGKNKLISLNEKYKPIPIHDFDSFRYCGKVLGIVNE